MSGEFPLAPGEPRPPAGASVAEPGTPAPAGRSAAEPGTPAPAGRSAAEPGTPAPAGRSAAEAGEPAPVAGHEAAARGKLTVGSQIAGYRIMEQIGRGGMAVVYRAIDLRLDRPVALKVLTPELARDAAFRQRFIRESRAAAAVDHPCIIPVFDAGEADGVLFIAMRYVSGKDVRTLLDREGRLPAGRVVNIIVQVASALDAAHARGLVHRDVKPANMLLDVATGSGHLDHVYLSDFGLTKQSLLTSSLTSTGQFLGTLDYIAPEQIEGSRLVDGRADLYSLGCAAFEMLSGEPPFRRDQGVAVIWAQISAPPPQLTEMRPDLPPAVDRVLAKALAKVPGDRYQTCLEFAAALRGACELPADAAAQPEITGPARPTTQPAEWAGMADPAAGGDRSAAEPWWAAFTKAGPGSAGTADAGWSGRPADAGWSGRSAAAEDPPTRAASVSPARLTTPDSTHQPANEPPGGQHPGSEYPGGQYPGRQFPAREYPARQYGRGPNRRRPWWRSPTALVIGCLAVLCLAGGAVAVLRGGLHRSASAPPVRASQAVSAGSAASSAGQTTPAVSGPAATVNAYFTALNNHDYTKAWNLGGRNTGSSFTTYVNGYDTTAKNTVTIVSVSGNVVTARIIALQTDGTVKTYQGTYTVTDGVITQFSVRQVG